MAEQEQSADQQAGQLTEQQIKDLQDILVASREPPKRDLFESRSVRGPLLALLTFLLSKYGVPPELQGEVVNLLTVTGVGLGTLGGMLGTLFRKGPITHVAGVKINK